MKFTPFVIFTIFTSLALLGGCASTSNKMTTNTTMPLKTVTHVDLQRYMGDWRVIANVPYFAEKGCVDSIEGYEMLPGGKIKNTFTYRKGSFDKPQKQFHASVKVVNAQTNAEWRVKFFGLISAKYFITDLDPNYRWAVIAHPSRKYGWVLAREKTLPDETYRDIIERTKAQGYDPAQFVKVPQLPSQLPPK